MSVSKDKLMAAVNRYGPDYTTLVFNAHSKALVTLGDAAASKAPTLFEVTNFFSREATLMWLRFHIAETFAFLGIFDTASKGQIMQTAELILDNEIFGQLNLDEFLSFLKQFKRGDYGKIYQSSRPNPQEFLMCLRPFWNELSVERGRAEQQKRIEQLSKERHTPLTPEQEQHAEEIIKRLSEKFDLKKEEQ